jgi:hypothetical protein
MATIVTRIGKGAPLSIAEGDANFTNLNDDKIELTDLSITTGATGETSALSYNSTTGVFTFTPVETGDLIGLTDISVSSAANSGSGSLSYNNTTGVFTFTPADLSSYLTSETFTSVVQDTTPQLGGNLDVQSNSITTSTTNGNIELAPNGTGLVIAKNLRVTDGKISVNTADTNLNLQPGPGAASVVVSGDNGLRVAAGTISVDGADTSLTLLPGSGNAAVNIQGDNGLQISGDGVDAYIFTATTDSNLLISANGTGVIGFGSSIFIENNPITTSITNGDINITPTGTGKLKVATGVDLVGGTISTSTTDGDITVTGNGDGFIVLDGATKIGLLEAYAESIDVLAGVSGTLTIDATEGPIKYVVPSGNITINGFSSPVGGQTVKFLIDQSTNETSFTLTLGAGILLPGGTAPTLTSEGNDLLTITCLDDENGLYIATFVADFQ